MKSLSLFFITLLSSLLSVYAVNNFAGITAASAVGGVGASDTGSGFDCDALHRASRAAVANGLRILAGIYIPGKVADNIVNINNEVQVFRAAYATFGADLYIGLTVGNEVNDTAGNIMAKVYDVRGYLRSVGVKTPVSTVHAWVRIRDEPVLCGAGFVAANAHAYFDGGRTSKEMGDFVFKLVIPALKKKCPGKKVIISESGWPSRGAKNGKAVPSLADERLALLNLNCACRDDRTVQAFAFEADDQVWKGNDVEKSFGFLAKFQLLSGVFKPCS